ncbi:MAG: hypothetical protein A3F13_04670 [Gammaproteobacteria bacterium RIFCSPHIGHO2_12_FULL_40_19]|nr:MAG: hypothetical protein A3F13_04670 [Gammaproteobacteria bacterium RIFCSPHIGHO2_12_FULL_40_19]
MEKIKFLFPLFLFVLLIIFFWRGMQTDPHTIPSPLIGKSTPSFQLPSVFDSKKIIDESIFLRHVSVLNVFATWCISCHAEHFLLMDFHQHYPSVQLIGLAFRDKKSDVVNYLKKAGNPFNTVIDDANGKVGIDFGVYGTPETFVIDQQGIIRDKITGPVSAEILKDELLPLIQKLQRAG